MPTAMSVWSRIVWPAPLASAAWRSSSDQRPLGRDAAVVEDGLADQLDLDLAVEAQDRAHEHVVAVVVGRRPGVGSDRVLAVRGPIVSASRTMIQPVGVFQVVSRRVGARLVASATTGG